MYTNAFEEAVNHAMLYEVGGWWRVNAPGARDGTIARACGYVNDPKDRGGETKYGIAKKSHPGIDIKSLTWDSAKLIYYTQYWLPGKCDKMPGRLAALHFDGSIHHGGGTSAKFIQRALGVTPDGSIGQLTLAAIATKDVIQLCNSVCDQREKYYRAIVANDPTQAKYLNGWLRRVKEMRAFVTDPNRHF